MRPIAIIYRPGHQIGVDLHDALACLRNAGIDACNAVIGRACALIWVDDEHVAISVETLRSAAFQTTALIEPDDSGSV
jgi:hypothetical protein